MAVSMILLVRLVERDNSVERYAQETDNSVNEKVDMREKHAAMKKVYKELKESYSSLKEMTKERLQQPRQLNFVDPRVRELWTLAEQANMTADELASFKVSLSLHAHEHTLIPMAFSVLGCLCFTDRPNSECVAQ